MGRYDYVKSGDPLKPCAASWNDFIDTARVVKGMQTTAAQPAGEFNEHVVRFAKSTSAIAAGSFASPTTGTFSVYEKDESDTFPRSLIITTDSDLLGASVAHYMNFAIPSGTQIMVFRDYLGEWVICWADC